MLKQFKIVHAGTIIREQSCA